jgi:hypothetical protein
MQDGVGGMSELEKTNLDELAKKNLQSPSLAERVLQVAGRAEVRTEKKPNEEKHEYSGSALTEGEYKEFKKKELEERKRKFVEQEGPFDRYDDVGKEFKDWERKNYGYSVMSDPSRRPNPVPSTPPTFRGTCGSAKQIDVPCRPSDRRKVLSAAKDLLGGRLLDRLSDRENEEKEAGKRLENQIDSSLALDNKTTQG